MNETIMVASIVQRFLDESLKQSNKPIPKHLALPGSKIWKACQKVASVCAVNNFDPTLFVLSRFDSFGWWAKKKFKVKSLPCNLLVNPKPEETYQEYVKKLKDRWRDSLDDHLTNLNDPYRLQFEDSMYRVKSLNLTPEKYLSFASWLAPCFLATSGEFMYLVESGRINGEDIPQEVHELWDKMEDSPKFAEYILRLSAMVDLEQARKEWSGS